MKSQRFVLTFTLVLMHAHNGHAKEKVDECDKGLFEASNADHAVLKAIVTIAQPSAINYFPCFLPSVIYPLPQQVLVPQ